MPVITLIDWKGDYVELIFTGAYKTSRAGLVETWVYVAGDYIDNFWQIPLPIFTEWWE